MGKEGKNKLKNKLKIGKLVALRGVSSGKYVTCELNGMVLGSPVYAGLLVQSSVVQSHHHKEKKEKVYYGTHISFKTQNGKYLCA
jgi:hypothetical protein